MSAKTSWDIEARWRGDLTAAERKVLRGMMERWDALGETQLKLGKERSRLQFSVSPAKALEEARRRMMSIAEMVEKEAEDSEGASALREMASAPEAQARALTLREVEKTVRKEWSASCALSLNALLGPEARLQVRMGRESETQS